MPRGAWPWGIQVGPYGVNKTYFCEINFHNFITSHMQHFPFPACREKDNCERQQATATSGSSLSPYFEILWILRILCPHVGRTRRPNLTSVSFITPSVRFSENSYTLRLWQTSKIIKLMQTVPRQWTDADGPLDINAFFASGEASRWPTSCFSSSAKLPIS